MHRTCTIFLAAILFLSAAHASPDSVAPPSQANCTLTQPPAEAGEAVVGNFYSPKVFAVYPRAKDIDSKYTGCQVLWISGSTEVKWPLEWAPFMVIEFKNGRVLRTWSQGKELAEYNACTYDPSGQALPSSVTCPPIGMFPMKSMRPGCLRAMLGIDNSPSGLKGCKDEE